MCGDVVEVDPRDGLRQQVVERGRHVLVAARPPSSRLPSRWNVHEMNARKPPRLVLHLAHAAHVLDALLERLDVAVHHRRGRRHAESVRVAHDVEPLVRVRLLRRDDVAHAVDEDLAAAAGQRVEPRVAQTRERLPDGQLRPARDVLHLGRGEAVEVDRVAALDRAEQVLVEVDPEVGMVPALHEHAGAADRERLLDLLEDHRLRQQVALARVARAAVEGAEVAVGDADVRVVDVPVDDEGDAIRVGLAVPHLVRDAPDGDEVARAQERDRVVVADALAVERPLEDRGDGRLQPVTGIAATVRSSQATPGSRAKRSSGTWWSSPTSRAISRNV